MARVHYWIVILASVLMIAHGCSFSDAKPEPRALPVALGEAVQRDVPLFIEVIGNVYAKLTVQIRPQVGGVILEAYVKEGEYVKKGDPLYLIDPRPYQAALDKAKATLVKDTSALQFAEIRVERYADLVKKDYFSKLNYDQYLTDVGSAKGQIQSDQADIALAELNLEWTKPTSPIEGKISQYNIDPGNLVQANDPNALTDIRQLNPADIRFYIPQKYLLEVQKSHSEGTLKLEVFLPQDPVHPRQGDIYFIDNHVDLTTGTVLLKGSVPNDDEFLWPGEFVQVRLILKTDPKAILIPSEALRIGQEGPYVYVYKPETSTVEYRLVTKGEQIDHMVVIKTGVNAGDKVVTKGQVNLRPGSKVYLAPEKKGSQ